MKRMIWPCGVGDLLEHRLQALLELAAILRAGDQRAHVERDDALVLQAFGHVAADDALRQALDDGGLADAGLADEHRVVLGAARQHLDDAANLLVAADHRIELALPGELGQVAAVAFERLVGAFGILARDALGAADRWSAPAKIVSRVMPRCLSSCAAGERPAFDAIATQQMLGADVIVLQPLGFGLRQIGDELAAAATGPAARRRRPAESCQQLARRARDGRRVGVHLAQHFGHDAFALLDERHEQVLRLDLRRGSSARRAAAPPRPLPAPFRCTC